MFYINKIIIMFPQRIKWFPLKFHFWQSYCWFNQRQVNSIFQMWKHYLNFHFRILCFCFRSVYFTLQYENDRMYSYCILLCVVGYRVFINMCIYSLAPRLTQAVLLLSFYSNIDRRTDTVLCMGWFNLYRII